jgi:5-methylcytosine-specific restriction endonuclease McrA
MKACDKSRARHNVCQAAGGRCEYCGLYVGRRGTLDHWLPKALGGGNERGNLRWACIGCNGLKADMHPDEWERVKPPRVAEPQTAYERRCAVLAALAFNKRLRAPAALQATTED